MLLFIVYNSVAPGLLLPPVITARTYCLIVFYTVVPLLGTCPLSRVARMHSVGTESGLSRNTMTTGSLAPL